MANYVLNTANVAAHDSVVGTGSSSAITAADLAVGPPPTLIGTDLGLTARSQSYIHPSWLAKALAGDRQCYSSLHTQANFAVPKVESDFDMEGYKIKHQGLLVEYAQDLRDQGYQVYTEDSNSFKVNAKPAVISGTPDIVAIRGDEVLIVDAKTGQPRTSDQAQVLLYMLFVPVVKLHGIQQIPEGRLVYLDYSSVNLRSSAVTEEFKQRTRALVAMIKSSELPPVTPSARECRYCPVRHICSHQVDVVAEASVDW